MNLTALAVVLVLIAAIFHAAWNVVFKAQDDPLLMARRAAILAAVLWSPAALAAWLMTGRPGFPLSAWLLAAASAMLEGAYFVFLSAAYQSGALSSVYSIARGTAPLLAVFAGVVILRERLSGIEIVGIIALLTGIWLVHRPQPAGPATLPALATGVTIAAYSAIDAVGVHTAAPWLYGFVVWILTSMVLLAIVPARAALSPPHPEAGPPPRPGTFGSGWLKPAVVGMLMTSTFLIILIALRLAPLAVVSPLRESAIVLVTLWGIWRMDERSQAWMRLLGAAAVATGAVLVALG